MGTQVHKVVLLVEDLTHNQTAEELTVTLENNRYPEFCSVISVETKDIGGWHDEHPLNYSDTQVAEFKRIFEED